MNNSKSNNNNNIDKVTDKGMKLNWPLFHILAVFTILFLPLFHSKAAMDQTLMPRMIALCVFLALMTLAVLQKDIFAQLDFSIIKRRGIFPLMLLYFIITLFSIIFAINPTESLFDVVRTLIWISMTALVALIFLQVQQFRDWLPGYVFVAAGAAFTIGLVQYFGSGSRNDVMGVMSNINEYSTALLLMIPFICYGIYRYRWDGKLAGILALLCIGFMIILIRTRSVWVALALSALVICLILVFFPAKFGLGRLIHRGLAVAIIAGAAAVVIVFSGEPPEDDSSIYGRLRSITDLRHSSIYIRTRSYDTTIEMVKDHPLTGVGANNWKLRVPEYFAGRFDRYDELNWRRPHNDYLWVLAEKGIPGFVVYLSILALILYYIFSVLFRTPTIEERVFALCLLGGFISYLVVAFFNFPYERMNHQVYLSLLMGSAVAVRHRLGACQPYRSRRHCLLVGVPVVFLLTAGAVYSYSATMMEVHIKRARAAINAQQWQAALPQLEKARVHMRNICPLNNPIENYMGRVYEGLGEPEKAAKKYRKGLTRFPMHVNSLWAIAVNSHQRGELDAAAEYFEKIVSVFPGRRAHTSLSAVYYEMGDYESSRRALERIKNYKDDEEIMRNIRALDRLIEQNEQ